MIGESFEGIYCGPVPLPDGIWLRWNLDPVLLAALALLAVFAGRSRPGQAAVLVLAVAFVSPLCALSAALFSARVVHHVLLVAVAAPLLAAAWPGRGKASEAPPFVAFTAVLWAWHLPQAYDGALSNQALYWAMQVSLLVSATAFWRAALRRAQPGPAAFLWILAAYMQMGLLGAILTFAPEALYEAHALAPLAWGLAPLEDQQIGGLVMWVPAGLPFVAVMAVVARRCWREMQDRAA